MVLNFCRDVMLWWCLIVVIDFLLCVFSSHMFRITELRLLHFLWLSSLLYSFHISTHLTSRLSSHLYYFTLFTSLYSLYISAFTSLLSSHLHSLHISTVLSSHLYSPHISTFFTSLLFSHLYSLRIPILFTSLLSSLVYSLDIFKIRKTEFSLLNFLWQPRLYQIRVLRWNMAWTWQNDVRRRRMM
jgi:hypothetical protein